MDYPSSTGIVIGEEGHRCIATAATTWTRSYLLKHINGKANN